MAADSLSVCLDSLETLPCVLSVPALSRSLSILALSLSVFSLSPSLYPLVSPLLAPLLYLPLPSALPPALPLIFILSSSLYFSHRLPPTTLAPSPSLAPR